MKARFAWIVLMGFAVASLPAITAQEEKKSPGKPDEKQSPPKKVQRVDEAIVLAAPVLRAKIRDIRSDETTKEIFVSPVNLEKYREYVEWEATFKEQLPRVINLNEREKKEHYLKETTEHLDRVFDGDNKLIVFSPEMRVRTATAPKQFDATGAPRKTTPADLAKLKGTSRLPGYLADFGALRVGQIVDISMPKSSPQATKPPVAKTKKDFIGGDPNLNTNAPAAPKISAYLIYVIQDAP